MRVDSSRCVLDGCCHDNESGSQFEKIETSMKAVVLAIVTLAFVAAACRKGNEPDPTTADLPFVFQDGFESADGDLGDLFVSGGSRWTGIQQVNPSNGKNRIELDNNTFNEGNNSLKLVSKPSDRILSKIAIEKKGFFAPAGSTVIIEADFYINSSETSSELLLIDLECCSCWDASVPDNKCPGIRLKLSGDSNYLSIERGKILGKTITQTVLDFPMNEWVNVKWEMKLAPNEVGENLLVINGQEVINEKGKNMPNKDEFRDEFAKSGIDFKLKELIGYERIQIGATANPTEHEIELFIDDFKMKIE